MKPVWLGLAIMALFSAAVAQNVPNLGNDPSKFDAQVESAMLKKDTTLLQTVLADDVRFTHGTRPDGTRTVWDRARWLELTPKSIFTLRDLDSVEVEPHGEVVETTGHVHVKSGNPSNPEYHIWFVRVYARRNGAWQLLSNRTVRQVNGAMAAK